MITAKTITNAQIRALMASTTDDEIRETCLDALPTKWGGGWTVVDSDVTREARATCAEILNAQKSAS